MTRCISTTIMVLLLAGCNITRPVDPFGEQARIVCENVDDNATTSVSFNGRAHNIRVHKTDNPDQIYDWCGGPGFSVRGCTKGRDIYIPAVPTCYNVAAHELGHVFGVAGLDRPDVGMKTY